MYTENRQFEKRDFRNENLSKGSYEECAFIGCNFNGVDLSDYLFINCTFDGCDASLVKLRNTSLQQVRFIRCKLLGVQFSDCRQLLLEIEFQHCMAKLAVFHRLKLKQTRFTECNLQEADFTESDVNGASFERCDLLQATFFHTNLEQADLRSAYNYSIHPEQNRLKKARFSLEGVVGLLDSYGIVIE